MRTIWAIAAWVLTNPLWAAPPILQAEAERIAAINKAKPAVVAIFSPGGQGGGSGVLIDPEGYALTNFHVVGNNKTMPCGLPDGQLYDAVLVGLDRVGDVALIKLLPKKPGDKFPYAVMADSDQVRAGDWSLAMGNPFLLATDFTPTVTYGLVSGTNRYQHPSGDLLEYTDCIQIDTSINPGNSGGPLFNMKGEIIGINGRGSFEKRGRVNSGVGYAISINQIKNFLGHLYAGIDTDHATLGATVQSASEDEATPRMLVREVLPESDAGRRGLEGGDELVAFAGRPMNTVNQFKNVLGIYPKGWRLPLVFRRENERKEVLIRLEGLLRENNEEQRPMRPRPQIPGPKGPPSPAAKFYKEKKGFANYYFNEQAQERVLAALRKHGDFSGMTGEWLINADGELKVRKTPTQFRIIEPLGPDKNPKPEVRLTMGVEYRLEPLKPEQNLRDLLDPPNSGGLMLAMYHYRRFLTMAAKGFESGFYHGGVEPCYPPSDTAKSLKDRRIDCEVLHTEHAAVTGRWYFSRQNGQLVCFEVTASKDEDPCEVYLADYRDINGRQLPHRIEVRKGDERFGVFRVQSFQVSAAK